MNFNNSTNKELFYKQIFDFYAQNKSNCDKRYNLAEEKDIDKIYHLIENKSNINSLFAKTAIVILTANKYERNILHQKVYASTKEKIKFFEVRFNTSYEISNRVYAYWFEIEGYAVLHIHADVTGSYSIAGSGDIVRWILQNKYLCPTCIISFGICFGTNEKRENLGDVIISKKIYPYFIGAKVSDENVTVVDDNAFRINDSMNSKIKRLFDNNKFNDLDFKVYYKSYVSGEAVISSEKWRKMILETTKQEIHAGEMEGYGLFKECNSNGYNVPCFIVKSICDWGKFKNFDNSNKDLLDELCSSIEEFNNESININEASKLMGTMKDRLQAYASYCAYEALQILFENTVFCQSLLVQISDYLQQFKGNATTCNNIQKQFNSINKHLKFNYIISKQYVHRCLMLLESDNIIICETDCKNGHNDQCINSDRDASIDIIRR